MVRSELELGPLPPLPPTKWFANTEPAVVRERRAGLQAWLLAVMSAFAPAEPELQPTTPEQEQEQTQTKEGEGGQDEKDKTGSEAAVKTPTVAPLPHRSLVRPPP
eukprot:COSAG04_NODE_7632_length_1094_cov_1.238191_1_plen_104_part_10